MLQDINISPVQPSLAETNLSIVTRGGPFKPGFNEYTPLFERNDVQFQASGLAGNEDTRGFEGIASALYDRFSVSAGAFSYQTDGWRPNDGIQQNVEDLFMQAAVTADLNMQVELRRRESQQGDLAFNFDPDFFNPDSTRSLDQDTARFGLRYSPSPNSNLLVSLIYSDRAGRLTDIAPNVFPNFDVAAQAKTYQAESQYILETEWLNLIVGLGDTRLTGSSTDPFGVTPQEIDHLHPYAYTNLKFPESVTWTLGVAFDDFQEDPTFINRISPKLGVRWDITNNLALRAALFRWIKPTLAANQTLEPTQVAGFNQVYDDNTGDESLRRGVGLDWRLNKQLFVGAEATWRDLRVPVANTAIDVTVFDTEQEQLHRTYLFWTPTDKISLSAQAVYDAFEAQTALATASIPQSLKTFSVPLAARYFGQNGFIAGVSATYVDQNVVRTPSANALGFTGGNDNFVVVDATLGWRFPKRFGVASVTVYNLFDQKFLYQDNNFRQIQDEPTQSPYIPERRVVARATLYF